MKRPPVKSRGFTTGGRITAFNEGGTDERILHRAGRPESIVQPEGSGAAGTSERVIGRADKAVRRLHDTYRRMPHRRKNACAAVTAVSRQLAGYSWGG
jgi:hypothetical protein